MTAIPIAVFGGDRSTEFEERLNGATYAEIASKGGGIISTVRETRKASFDDLVESAKKGLTVLLSEGITTVEIKSGYGLDVETEMRLLRVIRFLGTQLQADIYSTCLAAHCVPPEYRDKPDEWLTVVCEVLLPMIRDENLADAVDAFCEHLAFSPAQVEQVFNAAKSLDFPVKMHAEQLSFLGGSSMAAKHQALSADHLEYCTETDARLMGENGTVAVLLPGAFYFLSEKQLLPVDSFENGTSPWH